ncbi:myotrophin-like [Actinia tenebrosa]|uniref:Myotrophin-like n=1 Tax=Actinia tenebrosa TaxID=6105 RepID=A0A6P8GY91_ACTTE|nr:myotrophin-like [Actinia tenebrosa]
MTEEIRWALQNGDMDKVNELFSKGFDANKEMGLQGRRPLHIAADYGQKDVLALLLQKGADINAEDRNGITPLLATIWEGHYDCAEFLLEKGATPNGKAPDGSTYVEASETKEIKELLKKHGAK